MTAPLRVIALPSDGAEDVVVDAEGFVWTGTVDGNIYKVAPDGSTIERVGNTGGRPLGLELYGDDILVCDAHQGLLAMSRTGAVVALTARINGLPMKFCNNAAVASDGSVWFSDSSTLYGIEDWKADFVQNTRTGRLFLRAPDGTVTQKLHGLAFANGVALAADESAVYVAQTAARDVVRLRLTGPDAGTRDTLVDDLPGYPDNISRGSDGLIWVTIASPRDPVVEALHSKAPLPLRKVVTRIPERVQPKPKRTVRVQAYDDAGRLVHDIEADATDYHMATGVREHDGQIWLGSLHEPGIAVTAKPAV